MPEHLPRIFIGSSTPNLDVARALSDCLEGRNFRPLVWDEGLLRPNESIFDGLLRLSKEVEFGVFIWGASDVTITAGQTIPAARDNVVFETGLFLGALGKERVFMVVDRSAPLKIPSDFEGIIRSSYDGFVLGTYDRSAVSRACNEIERSIRQRPVPPSLARLQGQWKSRFASGPFDDHPTLTDDVEITVTAKGIHLTGNSRGITYTGEGLVYYENQLIGDWTHPQYLAMGRGLFMLLVNSTADSMYGYCTSQDANGKIVFGKWIFARNNGSDEQLSARLIQAQRYLEESTIGPALEGSGSESPLPKASDYDVKILSPRTGEKVRNPDVCGTINKAIPRDYNLWVFRVSNEGGIWPLRECRINPTGDEWEANSCDIGGVTGDKRAFSVNLVGPDGLALITYMYEAMERHNRVRAELEKNGRVTNAPYSPTLQKKTRDMLECSHVNVERS